MHLRVGLSLQPGSQSPLTSPWHPGTILPEVLLNKKQRENLARYAYDISKIMVAVPVLGNALSAGF